MKNLSPALLRKLDTHYDKIASLFTDGENLEDIQGNLQISDSDMQKIEEVMFNMFPFYTAKDVDGNERVMKFNAYTLQSKEVTDVKEELQY